jgi:histidinol-phosphate/aromatic aminotransferase/cobyric acid decarboxylase-like protein
MPDPGRDLHHHGDREATDGLVDLAVNVYDGPRPGWLDDALRAGLDAVGAYPDPTAAQAALARHHGRRPDEVVATAGAAEAFTLLARARPWRRPVVVHPQFTEPHAALLRAGHRVTDVVLERPFDLDPALVPDDADLVVLGNPTNPTGVLHRPAAIEALLRPGRLVVVDEAFMDCVPGEPATLTGQPEVMVIRSLTKHWGIPGVRAGYVIGPVDEVSGLRDSRVPWSVSAQAAAVMLACATDEARAEAERRAHEIARWRTRLEKGLDELGVEYLPSAASFVLTRVGTGVHAALRARGVAVRRADTFPGLDASWVRIAVRPDAVTDRLVSTLSVVLSMP